MRPRLCCQTYMRFVRFLQAALNERIERGLEMPLLTAGFGRMKKAGSSLDEPAFEGGVLSHFLFPPVHLRPTGGYGFVAVSPLFVKQGSVMLMT